jgi:hypothetical protein
MALTYDIAKELLYGTVGKHRFHIRAFSGGGRGKKQKYGPGEQTLPSRLSTTIADEKHGVRGGPLPPGEYQCAYVAHHTVFHECVHLKTTLSSRYIASPFSRFPIWHGRPKDGDFYIHGRGRLGSDGCIVPEVGAELARLNKAVKECPGTKLTVVNASYMLPAELEGDAVV